VQAFSNIQISIKAYGTGGYVLVSETVYLSQQGAGNLYILYYSADKSTKLTQLISLTPATLAYYSLYNYNTNNNGYINQYVTACYSSSTSAIFGCFNVSNAGDNQVFSSSSEMLSLGSFNLYSDTGLHLISNFAPSNSVSVGQVYYIILVDGLYAYFLSTGIASASPTLSPTSLPVALATNQPVSTTFPLSSLQPTELPSLLPSPLSSTPPYRTPSLKPSQISSTSTSAPQTTQFQNLTLSPISSPSTLFLKFCAMLLNISTFDTKVVTEIILVLVYWNIG
jgi:hypothetical protein